MTRDSIVLITLLGYNVLLLGIGVWAARFNRDEKDFFLAGGQLGAWVSALSASASSSSAWTLLGVSGAAYAWGLSALWLFPATLGGFVINWFFIAPRLRVLAAKEGALTLSEIIAPPSLGAQRVIILRAAAFIILFAFMFYIASQFDGAGKAFAANFGWSSAVSVIVGALVVMLYTLVGGFWAVSVTDAMQAVMMLVVAVALPLAAVVALSNMPADAWAVALSNQGGISHGYTGAMGVAFVVGTLGIGLGYPGQPHVVNRFMASKDDSTIARGRVIAISWAIVVYSGMLCLGLAARALLSSNGLADGEQALFATADAVLPPLLAGLVLAAVLSAIMSTADSQLLSAAAVVAHDWQVGSGAATRGTALARIVVLVLGVLAVALALLVPADIFSRVLFAWHAVGSAFGPLLILRLLNYRISARSTMAAMLTGFGLTIVLHWFPDTPGDFLERLLPFVVALIIARIGATRQSL